MSASSSKQGARSLRTSLAFVIASVSVPALALVAVVLWHYASAEQTRLEEQAVSLSRSAALAIDRELAGLRAAAEILSHSPHLQADNFEAFHERSQELRQRLNAIAVLRDPSGRELVRADLPYGAARLSAESPQPGLTDPKERRFISDLIMSPVGQPARIAVRTPVMKDKTVAYVLELQVSVERIRQVILSEEPPAGWVVAVIDRNGMILARNFGQERFVGRPATPDLLANTSGPQGTWWGYTQEGTPVLGAYSRTRLTSWRVAVGVARGVLNAPLYRSLWILGGVALALAVISITLTSWFGRRITGALGALVRSAEAMERGKLISPPATPVREVNQVGQRLAEASHAIRQRHVADERAAEAGRRILMIFESITDSVFVLDREWRFTYLNQRAIAHVSGGRSLIGQNLWEAFPEAVGGELWRAYHEAMETGHTTHAEQLYEPLGAWFAATAYPSAEGLTVYFRDVTADKRVQEQQALMVRELHHRVRNTLATIQAIVNATARTATNIESFQQSFLDRVLSLSRTHTLLIEHAWASIPLRELLEGELAPYASGEPGRTQLTGPDLELSSDAALALGMAVHELTTNAAKHGALLSSSGRIEITWSVDVADVERGFELFWVEKNGPAVVQPGRSGFGTRLLDKILARQLRAEIETRFAPDGFRVKIRAPLEMIASRAT